MQGSASQLIAREGWVFIAAAVLLCILAVRLSNIGLGLIGVALVILLILLFRDPPRDIPSVPLGVLSPVDGTVTAIEHTDRGCLEREATRITIRVDNFGAYTARSPVEGKVLNLQDNLTAGSRLLNISGLWVRTDENDDIVVLMDAPRWLKPKSLIGYGERLGQGRPFGFVRLTYRVRVFIPINSRLEVSKGDYVRAGTGVLATIIHSSSDAV